MKETKLKISWDERYSVDHGIIDTQHQQLFSILAQLEKASTKDANSESILKVIDELYNYTQMHFNLEEEIMMKGHYNKFEEHKMLHDEFKQSILIYREQFELFEANEIALILCKKLSDWLLNHILFTDQDYAHLLKLK